MVYQNKTTKNSFAREGKKCIKTDNNSSLYIFFMDLIFSLFYHRKIYHSKTLINRGTRYLNLSIMELIPREEHMWVDCWLFYFYRILISDLRQGIIFGTWRSSGAGRRSVRSFSSHKMHPVHLINFFCKSL
jgi:hypothetical protein